jgi:hypothetical protein
MDMVARASPGRQPDLWMAPSRRGTDRRGATQRMCNRAYAAAPLTATPAHSLLLATHVAAQAEKGLDGQ